MPGKAGKPAEVRISLFGLDANHRNLQPAGVCFDDSLHRHALLVDRVIDCARLRHLKGQSIEPRHVGNVRRRPTIAAVEDGPTASWNPRAASETAVKALTTRGVNTSVVRLPQVHDTRKQGLVPYLLAVASSMLP
jgi:hypothetical protein